MHGTILRLLPSEGVQCVLTSSPYYHLRSYLPDDSPNKVLEIGQEATPDAYIAHLVVVFREVYRILKSDGVCWVNIGDTYGADKGLLGIPWQLAFALKQEGWIVRQEVIWEKPNVLPESVADRCTKSHESVFLLTKQPHYLYNADAIREPHTTGMHNVGHTWAARKAQGSPSRYGTDQVRQQSSDWMGKHPAGRNKRSVWHINTEASPDGHYAVMPRKLAEVCILVGSRTGDLVLDPFAGMGTTLLVAAQHQRHYLGIELSPTYCERARARLAHPQLHLWDDDAH